eukprot:1153090-Pelagomonas_calceolata.AAC.3
MRRQLQSPCRLHYNDAALAAVTIQTLVQQCATCCSHHSDFATAMCHLLQSPFRFWYSNAAPAAVAMQSQSTKIWHLTLPGLVVLTVLALNLANLLQPPSPEVISIKWQKAEAPSPHPEGSPHSGGESTHTLFKEAKALLSHSESYRLNTHTLISI